MMAALTRDARFESVQELSQEGDAPKNMCEVLDRYINRGIEQGIQQGVVKGVEQGVTNSIRSLMKTMHLTLDQAMAALEVPAGEREKYAGILSRQPGAAE